MENAKSIFTLYLIDKFYLSNFYDKNPEIILNILNAALDLMFGYLEEHILEIIHDDLDEELYESTFEILKTQFVEEPIIQEMILQQIIYVAKALIYKFHIPKRSYKKTYIRKTLDNKPILSPEKIERMIKQIDALKAVKQPEQRTDEWYIFRNSTLTASNIYKVFISEYTQSQLILEKCEPMDMSKFKNTQTNTPMHHGQKYEPISIQYYELMNKTMVTDFGCIPHPKYPFMAASPDGIVCDPSSPLFGRMLEIKNVVSREINGIPKMEYWVQMQLQMEVCDLNECDFLETKFMEYYDEEEWQLQDANAIIMKGRFLQFCKDETPIYAYPPLEFSSIEYENWAKQKMESSTIKFVRTIYWRLEVVSCVLVLRNKVWFSHALPLIADFWHILVSERESGAYKERIGKKQKMAREHAKAQSDFPKIGCLISMDTLESSLSQLL